MRNIPRFQVRQSAAGAGVAARRTRCCSITRHRRGDDLDRPAEAGAHDAR